MHTVMVTQAERMMTRVDWEEDWLEVHFGDGRNARISASALRDDRGRPLHGPIREVSLVGFHDLILRTADGASVEVPWDFVRHFARDPGFEERERRLEEAGRRLLGGRVRRLRESCGLTQSEAARRSGVGRVTLARLEKGGQSPTLETLEKLARGLGLRLSELLGAPGAG